MRLDLEACTPFALVDPESDGPPPRGGWRPGQRAAIDATYRCSVLVPVLGPRGGGGLWGIPLGGSAVCGLHRGLGAPEALPAGWVDVVELQRMSAADMVRRAAPVSVLPCEAPRVDVEIVCGGESGS